jgi:hypothetical protein
MRERRMRWRAGDNIGKTKRRRGKEKQGRKWEEERAT